ncbi:MAG: 3-demethylubiquinone-9 3-methyltransferase [Promethearchaeota archaeon CR_4]|nr:MAG: 3-demethylubiquinone-9 3-methyltransferase [Candidatus Lokiarchaeota archaeon CR_4]
MNFYVSIFKNSQIGGISRYGESGAKVSGIPHGSVLTVTFTLDGQEFMALNGGPVYKFTPAISFYVKCETPQEIDTLWKKLSTDGTVLMELDKYPFSDKYGWLQDKYGLSWQLNLESGGQKITPLLMFVGNRNGKAEEAMNFYSSLFEDSRIISISRYRAGDGDIEGHINHGVFSLGRQEFMAMESSLNHLFTFTPAISFLVNCDIQAEIDHFWEKLTVGGEEVQCGWLIDKYGISWQIVPTVLGQMMLDKDARKTERVMQALLPMKKLDITILEQAYEK